MLRKILRIIVAPRRESARLLRIENARRVEAARVHLHGRALNVHQNELPESDAPLHVERKLKVTLGDWLNLNNKTERSEKQSQT